MRRRRRIRWLGRRRIEWPPGSSRSRRKTGWQVGIDNRRRKIGWLGSGDSD
jgi:hypothetical protein